MISIITCFAAPSLLKLSVRIESAKALIPFQ